MYEIRTCNITVVDSTGKPLGQITGFSWDTWIIPRIGESFTIPINFKPKGNHVTRRIYASFQVTDINHWANDYHPVGRVNPPELQSAVRVTITLTPKANCKEKTLKRLEEYFKKNKKREADFITKYQAGIWFFYCRAKLKFSKRHSIENLSLQELYIFRMVLTLSTRFRSIYSYVSRRDLLVRFSILSRRQKVAGLVTPLRKKRHEAVFATRGRVIDKVRNVL